MATFILQPNGRFRARIRKRGGKRASRTFDTKTAARLWAQSEEAQIERGTWIDPTRADKLDVGPLMDEYISDVLAKRRNPKPALYRAKRLKEEFGPYRLSAVVAAVVASFRDARLKDGLAPATVLRELGQLSGFFTWVRKTKLIPLPANPVSGIALPPPSPGRNRRLKDGEEKWILRALEDVPRASGGAKRKGNYRKGTRNPIMKKVMLFGLESAMREGEIAALEWSGVDLKQRVASLKMTKNGDPRDVPLSSRAAAILVGIKGDRKTEGKVFRVSAEAIKRSWIRTMRRARELYVDHCTKHGAVVVENFLEKLTFHDLRHEATSRLATKLPNVIELAAVTGHKDLRSLKRYYHPKAADLAKKLG